MNCTKYETLTYLSQTDFPSLPVHFCFKCSWVVFIIFIQILIGHSVSKQRRPWSDASEYLSWVCTVGICPTKRTLGFHEFELSLQLCTGFEFCTFFAIVTAKSYLRNRSALAVMLSNNSLFGGQREWFIFVQLTEKQWIITQQFTHFSWAILIQTYNKRRKHIWSIQILPTFRHCTEKSSIRLHEYVTFLKHKNDVTPQLTSFCSNN